MTKTIKEWLSELPDGYRERALANIDERWAEKDENCMAEALYSTFNWSHINEGFAFWSAVKSHYSDNKPLPILP